jgi:multicomponent Na+:H+ antiporter subunit E
VTGGRPDAAPGMSRWRSVQPLALVWLTLVWVSLWQDLSFANVAAGLAVALAVSWVFPLPRLRLGGRVHPGHLVVLLVRFLYDVVVASLQVAWLTLRLRRQPRSAVLAVDLHSESDLVLTLVAELSTLVPGTLAVEAHRHTHTLFLHVLDLGDDDLDTFRRRALDQERRVLRALGMDPVMPLAHREGDQP